MRFLITGGARFIGSHLVEDVLARGHPVHVTISTGSTDNVRHLKFGDAAHGRRFNISSQQVVSMFAFADRVRQLAASDPEIHTCP